MKSETILTILDNKDQVIYNKRGIRIEFAGKRRVLSTSVLHGGMSEELTSVFNYNCLAEEYECGLSESTYEEELKKNASSIYIDSETTSGISTAAWMESVSVKEAKFEDVCVTAVVTAGVDKNAVRVGDPAAYYEKNGQFIMLDGTQTVSPGTINILLHINKNLLPGTMARALVISTEAKVAAIGELMLGSLYSTGIATGSGTDGTIIIGDIQQEEVLTDAGGHSKLGELIGNVVMMAVKEALVRQTGACPARQHKVLERGLRYGITIGSLWECYENEKILLEEMNSVVFTSITQMEALMRKVDGDSSFVVWASYYVHLMDQYEWGLLEWGEVVRESLELCRRLLGEKELGQLFALKKEEDIRNGMKRRLKIAILMYLLDIIE